MCVHIGWVYCDDNDTIMWDIPTLCPLVLGTCVYTSYHPVLAGTPVYAVMVHCTPTLVYAVLVHCTPTLVYAVLVHCSPTPLHRVCAALVHCTPIHTSARCTQAQVCIFDLINVHIMHNFVTPGTNCGLGIMDAIAIYSLYIYSWKCLLINLLLTVCTTPLFVIKMHACTCYFKNLNI